MNDWQAARDQWGPMVWQTIYRIVRNRSDAMDLFQEVFLEAYEADRDKTIKNMPGYLRWLAVRRGLDHLRRQSRCERHARAYADHAVAKAEQPEPSQEAEFAELVERVRRELARCPDNQAEAFWLGCVEQRSYSEVASLMGISDRSVGVLIHRARQRLREMMMDLRAFPMPK